MASSWSFLSNLAESLLPWQSLMTGAAYIMGIGFIVKGIVGLKALGESRQGMQHGSMKDPLLSFIVGGMLVYFPTGFEVLMSTTFGYSSILAYSDSSVMSDWIGGDNELGRTLTIIIQTIGIYAFIRGWVLIARSASTGQPPNGTGKGLTHIFGGILAINIVGTLEMINNTLMGV